MHFVHLRLMELNRCLIVTWGMACHSCWSAVPSCASVVGWIGLALTLSPSTAQTFQWLGYAGFDWVLAWFCNINSTISPHSRQNSTLKLPKQLMLYWIHACMTCFIDQTNGAPNTNHETEWQNVKLDFWLLLVKGGMCLSHWTLGHENPASNSSICT